MNGVEATPWMASCPTSSSTLQQYALVRLLWLSLVRKSDAAEGAGHANASFGEDPTTSSFNMSSSNPCVGRIVCGPAHVPRPIYRGRNGGLYYINESGLSVYVASSEVTMHDAQIAGGELVHAPSISIRARTQFSLSAAGGNMSGYELQMKNFVSNHLTMTSKEVPQLVRGSVMRMSLCGEVGTSEWEPLEVHRSAKAVLILLHCTVWAARLEAALDYVKGVFVGQFNHMIRRCYVVDPPDAIRELIQSWGDLQKEFVMLDSRVPIDVSGESTTKEVASAVAAELLQRHKQCVEAAENESAAGPSTTLDARVQSKHKITRSRWSKLAGDCMLQLGSLDKAFAHYSRTQFSSQTDPLWCAATVQAIAGVRYQQLSPFIQQLRAMSDALVWIQSDSIDWKGTEVQQCLRHLSQTRHVASRSLEVLSQMVAQHYVSQTVRRRLRAEITGCLQDKLSDYDGLMQRAQSCVAAGSNELEADPMAYYVGRDLKNCAEELIRVIFLEVEIYMAEALRQLELAASANPSSRASLRALELDVHLKLLSFIAEKGNKAQFFEQVKKIRTDFAHDIESVEGMYPQFMNFLALQSLHLGCHRLAISFLMDLAARHSAAHEAQRAVECVLRATRASKLHLNLHDLAVYSEQDAIAKALARTTSRYSLDMSKSWLHHETELMSNHSFVLVADLKGCNTANSSAGTLVSSDSSAMIHVRLLKELIQQLGQRSSQRGLRCRAATLLLFRYATHLSSCDQEHLLQLAAADAQFVHFQLLPPTDPLPFITNWEALPLPPHLAPKTVAVGGPVFTFIDTHRLRLTVLSLNGRKLNSGVVWAVGDVGTVVMTLRNPFDQDLHISSLVLQCRSCEELNDDNTLPPPAASYTTGSLAPTSYVLRHVDLRARACIQVQLHVMPQMAGYLLVEGAELRLSNIHAPIPITGRLPVPMGIPVLQRLPLVSCTVSRSELEIFSGQQVEFHVRVVNCGPVPVERIALTAHSEVCLLENCEGCLERRSNAEEATVVLNKAALQEAATSPLQPGEVVFIPVRLQAPAIIPKQESHFVVFRVDCSIPHEPPSMPPNVPHAVPVFGVIPRRVLETRMRLFHAPTIVISSLRCSKDRRFLHIHLVNRSPFYSVALKLSTLAFARLPDAVLVAGADYIVPPIDITTMPKSALPLRVPWLLREPPYCVGELQLEVEVDDEVRVAPLQDGLVCLRFEYTNPVDEYSRVRAMWESKPEASAALEHVLHDEEVGEDEVAATQCIVGRRGSRLLSLVSSLATIPDGETHHHRHVPPPFIKRCSVEAGSPPLAIEVPLLAPVSIHLVVSAPPSWKPLPVSLRVRVVLEHPFDVGSLSGPVDAAASVGGDVGLIFHGVYELFAFKTGIHTLIVTLSDDEREVSHIIEVSATVPNDE